MGPDRSLDSAMKLKKVKLEEGVIDGYTRSNDPMVLVFDTSLGSTTIYLPLFGNVNCSVDWGDGTSDSYTTEDYHSHTYSINGVYQVSISGRLSEFGGFGTYEDALISCLSFGELGIVSLQGAFEGCSNLTVVPSSIPSSVTDVNLMFSDAISFNQDISSWDTSNIVNMSYMFYRANSFNQNINSWNTSNVTNMSYMFSQNTSFNQPLNSWNTSNVTNMNHMFSSSVFNQAIGSWNTSSVTNMSRMFSGNSIFNQTIDSWNTSSVTDMSFMFFSSIFNQPLNSWNTSSVTTMAGMFYLSAFNQPIDSWNTSNVISMSSMFRDGVFNQPLNSWITSNVTNMSLMFYQNSAFNQPLSSWDTSNVTTMSYMFSRCPFNQPIGSWNVSSVLYMTAMFYENSVFDQPLGSWNVSSVLSFSDMFRSNIFNQDISLWNTSSATDMTHMFIYNSFFNQDITAWNTASVSSFRGMFSGATSFNQAIGSWNTSSATNMNYMFYGANSFNQNLGSWNVSSLTTANEFLKFISLSTENYDALLAGWGAQIVKSGVLFDGGNSQYSQPVGEYWRNELINAPNSWSIIDGGPSPIAGLQLWLDSDDTSTISHIANLVTNWTNKGLLSEFRQATSSLRPLTNTSLLNGRNVIDFNDDYLVSDDIPSSYQFLKNSNTYLIAAVVKFGSNADPGTDYALMGSNQNSSIRDGMAIVYSDTPSSNNRIIHTITSGADDVNNTSSDNFWPANVFGILTLIADPSSGTASERSAFALNNGALVKNNTLSTGDSRAVDFALQIGAAGSGANPLVGSVAEILIISGSNATESNRVVLRDYLNEKWSVY